MWRNYSGQAGKDTRRLNVNVPRRQQSLVTLPKEDLHGEKIREDPKKEEEKKVSKAPYVITNMYEVEREKGDDGINPSDVREYLYSQGSSLLDGERGGTQMKRTASI